MFNYKFVKNAATGDRYWIDTAVLENDEGPTTAPDGVDLYHIDLQPYDPDGSPLIGVDLAICRDGTVNISKGLTPASALPVHDGHVQVELIVAEVSATEPDTLIVPKESAVGWPEGETLFDDLMDVLMDNYLGVSDTCGGPNSEEARAAGDLLVRALTDGIAIHKDEILSELRNIKAVNDDIDEYYSKDARLLHVLKTLLPEEVST